MNSEPYSLEAERAILGALIDDKDVKYRVFDVVKKQDFYDDKHQKIFNSILELDINSSPIDLVTVSDQLKKKNEFIKIGRGKYLYQLVSEKSSFSKVDHYCKIIKEKSIKRQIISTFGGVKEKAHNESEDVFNLISEAQNVINSVTDNVSKDGVTAKDSVLNLIEHIDGLKKGELNGLKTSLEEIDNCLMGLEPRLYLIAARAGMGKTSFAIQIAKYVANERQVDFYSYEMPEMELTWNMVASDAGMTAEYIKNRKLQEGKLSESDQQKLLTAYDKHAKRKMIIYDRPMPLEELIVRAKISHKRNSTALIVVDYLQLISADVGGRNREQEVSKISRSLKLLSKDLNIPVIALSQLNREAEYRSSKKPKLSDLRESGSLEQDADSVMLLWRPSYYRIMEDEQGNEYQKGLTEVDIVKNRGGSTGVIDLIFDERKKQYKTNSGFIPVENTPFDE